MSILTRKRRRSEALQDADGSQQDETQDPEEDIQDDEGSLAKLGDIPNEGAKKEREVWEAFREEQYEVLEQLPLSLHRSFALMLELDQQVQENEKELVPTLRDYVSVRKKLANTGPVKEQVDPAVDHERDRQPTSPENNQSGEPLQSTRQEDPTAAALLEGPPASSRQLLTKVANLSEEIVRASNEKVNVARFAYDLVDRYIRDLDRAIKEQETSLSLGLRQGTYPASIILPEIVPPTSTRASRAAQQPPPMPVSAPEVILPPIAAGRAPVTLQTEDHDVEEDEPTLGIESNESSEHGPRRAFLARPRRRRTAKWSRKKKVVTTLDGVEDKGETSATERGASLKLTVPPLSSVASQAGNTPGTPSEVTRLGASGDMPIDPNEPLYCYCNQVSFGVMVACDNKSCEREWFHLGCVGLAEPPSTKAKWYCRDCAEKMGPKKKGR